MEIKTTISKEIFTTDGKHINSGDEVVFIANDNKPYVGKFMTITKRGALQFEFDDQHGKTVTFCVMPASIVSIYKADISIPYNIDPSSVISEKENENE